MLHNLIKVRRELHKIPELSFKEFKTSKYIEEFLKKREVKYKKIIDTGIVAFIEGKNKDKIIGFRADIDALPIEEKNNFEYKSIYKGKMHACGHDFHMSILLNLINYFSKNIPQVSLLFIFQPGEEGAGGALKMINNGVFDIFGKPDYIFGYHINPEVETGIISAYPGEAWAGSIEFEIEFKGPGGHGAYPHKSVDLVYAFSNWYQYMQSVISRSFNPQHALLLTCGKLEGAVKSNVFSSEIIAGCTFRYFQIEDKEKFLKKVKAGLSFLENSMNCSTELNIISDYIPLVNDKKLFENIKKWYSKQIEKEVKTEIKLPELVKVDKVTISDDMGYFLKEVKGVYFFLGVNNGNTTGLHTATLNPDENALLYGFNFFKEIVEHYEFW